jgi:hypothetical protein
MAKRTIPKSCESGAIRGGGGPNQEDGGCKACNSRLLQTSFLSDLSPLSLSGGQFEFEIYCIIAAPLLAFPLPPGIR